MKCACPYYVIKESNWVPCGKCNFCIQRKRSEWSFRLYQELKAASSAAFITLTYDNDHAVQSVITKELTLEKTHVQKFLKRLRKHESKFRRPAIRYYLVGEYGTVTERPHYHALVFNLHSDTLGCVQDLWGLGAVDVGDVEPASIAYVSGYVINRDVQPAGTARLFPFAVMSKGIGKEYLTPQMMKYHRRGKINYAQLNGFKSPLPRYYSERMFTKLQKRVMVSRLEAELDKKYFNEVERLSALHSNPTSYYLVREAQAYDRIRVQKRGF